MKGIIQKIRTEIEWRKKILFPHKGKGIILCKEMTKEYDSLLSFLSTLEKSEKPMQEGLEEEIGSYMSNKWKFGCITPITPVVLPNFTTEDLKECARHFAKWGAEHLKK